MSQEFIRPYGGACLTDTNFWCALDATQCPAGTQFLSARHINVNLRETPIMSCINMASEISEEECGVPSGACGFGQQLICAVSADSCDADSEWVDPDRLRAVAPGVDCRRCVPEGPLPEIDTTPPPQRAYGGACLSENQFWCAFEPKDCPDGTQYFSARQVNDQFSETSVMQCLNMAENIPIEQCAAETGACNIGQMLICATSASSCDADSTWVDAATQRQLQPTLDCRACETPEPAPPTPQRAYGGACVNDSEFWCEFDSTTCPAGTEFFSARQVDAQFGQTPVAQCLNMAAELPEEQCREETGACGFGNILICAASADACDAETEYVSAARVRELNPNLDCRRCEVPQPETPQPVPAPTPQPTRNPTPQPTPPPTRNPTPQPTPPPTRNPTPKPVPDPTTAPVPNPTRPPTRAPVPIPTPNPTGNPTRAPVPSPTSAPTRPPTRQPVTASTSEPTLNNTQQDNTPQDNNTDTTVTPAEDEEDMDPTTAPTPRSRGKKDNDTSSSIKELEDDDDEEEPSMRMGLFALIYGSTVGVLLIVIGFLTYYIYHLRQRNKKRLLQMAKLKSPSINTSAMASSFSSSEDDSAGKVGISSRRSGSTGRPRTSGSTGRPRSGSTGRPRSGSTGRASSQRNSPSAKAAALKTGKLSGSYTPPKPTSSKSKSNNKAAKYSLKEGDDSSVFEV